MNPFDTLAARHLANVVGQTLTAFGENHIFGNDAVDRDFVRNSIAGYLATLGERGVLGDYEVDMPRIVKKTWEDIYPDPLIRDRAQCAVKLWGSVFYDALLAERAVEAGYPYTKHIEYIQNFYMNDEDIVPTAVCLGTDLSQAEIELEMESYNGIARVGDVMAVPVWTIETPGEYLVTDIKFRPARVVNRIMLTATFPAVGDEYRKDV